MPVLQSQRKVNDPLPLGAIPLLSRAYVEAVASGDPLAHAKGLALAEAVWVAVTKVRSA